VSRTRERDRAADRVSRRSDRRIIEDDFDHRRGVDQVVERLLVSIPGRARMIENRTASCHVDDLLGSADDVDMAVSFQMNHDTRIRPEIGEPVPSTLRARDEESSVDVEHPDLDPAGQPSRPTSGRDVDGRIIDEFGTHEVHSRSVENRRDRRQPVVVVTEPTT
jgi:hypothetical protein